MSEKSRYKSITPVNGEWYFVGKFNDGTKSGMALIYPVAVWAETHEGDVVGLLGDIEAKTDCGLPRLVGPPAIDGIYLCKNKSNKFYINKLLDGDDVKYRRFLK